MSESTRIPKLLTLKEVARVTTIPSWRIYEMLQQGKGPPFMKLGRTFRFSEAALVGWIEQEHAKAGKGSKEQPTRFRVRVTE